MTRHALWWVCLVFGLTPRRSTNMLLCYVMLRSFWFLAWLLLLLILLLSRLMLKLAIEMFVGLRTVIRRWMWTTLLGCRCWRAVQARKITIHPKHYYRPALRIELYGCEVSNSTATYTNVTDDIQVFPSTNHHHHQLNAWNSNHFVKQIKILIRIVYKVGPYFLSCNA